MSLTELTEALDLPARQVRHLIAEGVMPPGAGRGRYADGFGEEHLRLGLEFKRLLAAGMGVPAIRAKMALDADTLVYRDEWVEVRLREPGALDDMDEAGLRAVLRGIKRALARSKTGEKRPCP